MAVSEPIMLSLERFGEICADPAPLIYRRLFAQHPDFEDLFAMDTDGGVRGSMLTTCFDWPGLTPLELRRALLEKRHHAFTRVFRFQQRQQLQEDVMDMFGERLRQAHPHQAF